MYVFFDIWNIAVNFLKENLKEHTGVCNKFIITTVTWSKETDEVSLTGEDHCQLNIIGLFGSSYSSNNTYYSGITKLGQFLDRAYIELFWTFGGMLSIIGML
jgi:hypothetical protein